MSSNNQSSGYNDREPSGENPSALPKPQIEIIVDGSSIYKPGMKSFFINEDDETATISSLGEGVITGEFCTCDVVYTTLPGSTTVCSCDTVCACEGVCNCVSYVSCSCDGDYSCSCVSYTSTSCSCQSVSCGSPCACVPVH
ncbi:MAG: hypothetical protein LBS58_04025 [Coriobacteriales bacterium]|jgi:hypothetical protein|nr:hypothetical protein [Coriobacteriales bacterium]